jgi:proline iminopeptidase
MRRLILLIFSLAVFSSLKAQVSDSIPLSNASLYYEIKGEGSPILLLSGGPGLSSKQLSTLRDSLSQNYKCILFDQRGTGQSHTSPLDSTTINLKQSVRDISSLLKKLKIDRVTIVGHSWGAMLAVNFAIAHPAQINKLVLIGSGPLAFSDFVIQQDNIIARATRAEREYIERLQDSISRAESPSESAGYRRKFGKQFLRLISYDATRIDSIFEEVSKSKTNPKMQFLMFQDLQKINYNVKSKIGLLNFPTLVICGRQDPVGLFPSIQLKELNNKFNLVWVEKSGHFPWLENHESFYQEVFKFLQ